MKEFTRLLATDPSVRRNAARSLRFGGLYRVIFTASLSGLGVIAALNLLTPLDFFKLQRAFIYREGGWLYLLLFGIPALFAGFSLQRRVLKPLRDLKKALSADNETIPPEVLERALRRLLNLPLVCVLTNLVLWTVLAAALVLYLHVARIHSLIDSLFVFSRFFMIGMVASGLSFFLVESHVRKRWIPIFFPEGKLTQISGALRAPVTRRIRVLWATGTLNPMVILVITLLFVVWEPESGPASVRELSVEIFRFVLMLCCIFTMIALGLNFLVAKSIRGPMDEIFRVLRGAREGDFTQRIAVLSNDEVGILGDAANAMLRGLAERERIRETFGRYVTPEIRDRILSGRIPLSGERRVATLLFADLRDFTPYVEETSPEEVILSIKAYFTTMQRVIRQHGGLVLQYVGDEIEAAFGVPIPSDSHADDALRAALAMRNGLVELNRARSADGRPPFRHGIGIHTGMVLAGNTGSEDHLSYALIGDTVNLASRIQGLTKSVEWDIVAGEETVRNLKGSFELRKEAPATVKGYSKPVVVYAVLGEGRDQGR
ncbi:MAG: adenylate/guanylate cyclase domain-containing protein [Syntrophorhabdales bacterium]|jgi:class 3 adenylate cyclase